MIRSIDHALSSSGWSRPGTWGARPEKVFTNTRSSRSPILTVSELNRIAADVLDRQLNDVWVRGEVSGVRRTERGHSYFRLKDEFSQLDCVLFSSAARLRFELEDGMAVLVHGNLDIYVPAGRYQFIVSELEPEGYGVLQKAFEQLKNRLAAEGLFAPERKRPLPRLPRVVGIVTSSSGAVIHDMLITLRRNRARIKVLLCPVAVQGEGAAEQIAQALGLFGSTKEVEVVIVGRGGGSIEDLWAFNQEIVARAIAASPVPVVSGIGHEVDFTIADFVADVRAATPTAAAQIVAQGWYELEQRLTDVWHRLYSVAEQVVAEYLRLVEELSTHRCFEAVVRRVIELRLRLAACRTRLVAAAMRQLTRHRQRVDHLRERLARCDPAAWILRQQALVRTWLGYVEQSARDAQQQATERLWGFAMRLERPMQRLLAFSSQRLAAAGAKLEALSPLASLHRGYAICRRLDGTVVSQTRQVRPGEGVSVHVSDGRIDCRVEKTTTEQEG